MSVNTLSRETMIEELGIIMSSEEIGGELRLYELALTAWEYLSIEQEKDAIQNILRLRKLKKDLLSV